MAGNQHMSVNDACDGGSGQSNRVAVIDIVVHHGDTVVLVEIERDHGTPIHLTRGVTMEVVATRQIPSSSSQK